MSLTVKFSSKQGFDQMEKSFKEYNDNLKKKILELGKEAEEEILKNIVEKKKRPQTGEPTDLENNIKLEIKSDGVSWGIGKIADLNLRVPFWRALNWGSSHMVGKHLPPGTFQPGVSMPVDRMAGGNNPDGRWKEGMYGSVGGERYSPIVKNPIQPINYIEKTVFWLQNQIKRIKV